MSADNHATKATIGGALDSINLLDKFFEIPPYQRLYEWEKEQIETLLDDMKKTFETNKEKEYFIGNITTSIKSKNEQKIYVLIDGQQRLTTLWFIGFYLASKNCPNWKEFIMQGENLRIAMPIRDSEEKALKALARKITDLKGENDKDKNEKLSSFLSSNIHEKINNAFEYIESWFEQNIDKDNIEKFAEYIYENICFVFVTLAQKTNLNRFFVRMNNRGKQLEKHEILKARMLGAIQKSGGEWQKYAKMWDLCSDMDKYIFQSASDRSIFAPKSQDNNGTKSINDNDSLVKLADIVEKYKIPEFNESKDKDLPSKVESIIDFPTFLLHCYKLFTKSDIPIATDKLLDTMWEKQNNFKTSGKYCEDFIKSMLRYRVFFDYFVIKNTLGDDGFAIMRFCKSNGSYQPKAKSFEKLAMIQNYLRVARQGEKQNYEHWLTEFLEFLSSSGNLQFDEIKEIKEFVDNFLSNKDKNELPKSLVKKESRKDEPLTEKLRVLQEKLVAFLEKKNTEQIYNVNLKEHYKQNGNFTIDESFLIKYLSNGVNTPHYWFYRLEYYLWKWGIDDNGTNLKNIENSSEYKIYDSSLQTNDGKNFTFKSVLATHFHFRILGSIEHFSARQRKESRKQWDKDTLDELNAFGNLALISQNLNSSLSNELENFKKDKVIEQLKHGRLESLKYFIMCANLKGDEWTGDNAQEHQKQMIEILKQSLKI